MLEINVFSFKFNKIFCSQTIRGKYQHDCIVSFTGKRVAVNAGQYLKKLTLAIDRGKLLFRDEYRDSFIEFKICQFFLIQVFQKMW